MWPRRACEDDQVSTVLIVLFTYTGLRCDGGPKCGEAGRGGREGSPKSFVNKNEEAKTRAGGVPSICNTQRPPPKMFKKDGRTEVTKMSM
ncbi:uncharacterized protein LOC144013320 isoform X2 [Festucalex cinctus]